MNIAQRLNRFIPDLAETLVRFPIPVLCALCATVIINLDIAKTISLSSEESTRLIMVFAAGFLFSGAVNLLLEARGGLSKPVSHIIAAAAAGCVGAICYFDTLTTFEPVFLFPGLVLAVMCAGYIGGRFKEDAFWLFNARFALAIVLATLVACIFCGGLSAILYSLKYLFEFQVESIHHRHVWTTGISLFGPVYGLSLMPSRFDEPLGTSSSGSPVDRGVSILVNYIVLPLLAIYIVMLHIYAGKILMQWTLPAGQVGQMVLMFALGGTAIYLIARPWHGRGTRLTRWFLDWWFVFLTMPIVLLAVGVSRRILDYGVTPERFGLVIIGVWSFALIVYWGLKGRRIASWNILAVLCGLLLVSAFGPWGAVGVSISSQARQFSALLDRHGLLTDGKLASDFDGAQNWPDQAYKTAKSIIWFLDKKGVIDRLAPVFEGHSKDPFRGNISMRDPAKVLLNIFRKPTAPTVVKRPPPAPIGYRVRYEASDNNSVILAGPSRLTGLHRVGNRTLKPASGPKSGETVAWRDGTHLNIASDSRIWRAEIMPLLQRIRQASRRPKVSNPTFVFDVPGPTGAVQLIVTSVDSIIKDEEIRYFSMKFWVVLPNE